MDGWVDPFTVSTTQSSQPRGPAARALLGAWARRQHQVVVLVHVTVLEPVPMQDQMSRWCPQQIIGILEPSALRMFCLGHGASIQVKHTHGRSTSNGPATPATALPASARSLVGTGESRASSSLSLAVRKRAGLRVVHSFCVCWWGGGSQVLFQYLPGPSPTPPTTSQLS